VRDAARALEPEADRVVRIEFRRALAFRSEIRAAVVKQAGDRALSCGAALARVVTFS
jgi:hypothetical protein